ncbi:hypothetical protein M8J77_002136 [Diaphorina citri]|nr:hypothetical protein M8J77_002136 [Diaphorina citri]
MEQRYCLLVSCVVLCISNSKCFPGDGEKLRINPEEVERVVQMSNLTARDKTAKNVNFAWKMTVRTTLPTTMDPALTSTLDPEMNKKNNEIYDRLFAQLAYTLRDKTYLDRWLTEMDKGYHIFLYEIQKQDRSKFFRKFYGKDLFDGDDGTKYWMAAMELLRSLGARPNFDHLMQNIFKNLDGVYLGPENFNTIRKPTESEEAKNISMPAFNVMLLTFAKTFGNSDYKEKWMEAYTKGFDNLLAKLEEKGPCYYLNIDANDQNFQAGKGGLFYDGIIKYIKSIGPKDRRRYFKSFQSEEMFEGADGTQYFQSMINFLLSLRNRNNFLKFVEKLNTNKRGIYMGENFNMIQKPTASEEARGMRCPAYDLMLTNLAKAIGNETIRTRWLEASLDGFDQLVQQLVEKGPKYFLNVDKNDSNFKGCKGGIYWDSIIRYVNASGEAALDNLFQQFAKLPSEVTLQDIIMKKLITY